MKNLCIVFVTNNYTPYSGGVVSSINASVHELRKIGHEVFIITLDFLGEKHNDPDYVFRVPSLFKFTYKTNPMAISWCAKSFLYKQVKRLQPDVIHAHHPFLLGKAALDIAKKLHIPIVFTYHTIYEEYAHYILLPQLITRYFTKKWVLQFCRDVNGIITPSSAIKNYLINEGITTPIIIIPSWLQQHFLPTIKPEQKTPYNRSFRLLTVSRFVKEKNIPFIFNAFKKLRGNYTLTLVGYGAEYEAIKNYAYQELKLPPQHVRFVYKPSKEKLSQYYREADLFLFSSTTDTQGLVLAEAMAGGTPVIAVDGPGQRDVIQNGKNGFLVKSEYQMAKKIECIAKNIDLYGKMQDNAWRTAQKYAPKYLIGQLEAYYSQIIGGNKIRKDFRTDIDNM